MQHKAMKFRVSDEAHSKAIQEKLFSLGFGWAGYQQYLQESDKAYLFAQGDFITYAGSHEKDYFEAHDNEEYVLLDGELLPLNAKGLPSKADGAIKSDGGSSSYYQMTITNKAGETIDVETGDIIRSMLGNDFDLGNVLKALRRMYLASKGHGKAGTNIAYDVNKSKYFLDEFEHWNKP